MRKRLADKITAWLMQDTAPKNRNLSDFERIQYEIRPCDVLLIEGRSRVSEVIKMVTQSPWSHAALYVGRLHDIEDANLRKTISRFANPDPEEQLVIESLLGKGTIVVPLKKYTRDHIRICRPKGIARRDAQQVIGYAIRQLGMGYDVRHILDLMRFLFPWGIIPRRWRSSLFEHHADNTTLQICSSMLAEAFGSVRFPILPIIQGDKHNGMKVYARNPRLYTPSDFDYSPYFEIIKYPFFQLSDTTRYRELPWSEQASESNEEDKPSFRQCEE